MMGVDGISALGLLQVNLIERRHALEEEVSRGSIKTFEEYKYKCGEIRGLLYAERELVDLQEKLEVA
jgi:hypothetical protein